jgi:phage terminase large subunit-like protein
MCKEQFLLCDFVERVFRDERLTVDGGQLERYLDLQKYFPYRLFPWESFCFALHNCVYDERGELRFPTLFINVGRGAGKNGYLAFENFCLLTPVNGVEKYDIDIFAMSEIQAKASWEDVYEVLEKHKKKLSRHFYWTKVEIKNLRTGSKFLYNTSRPQSKDGRRPGKVDFDEVHAYESWQLIEAGITGLGKKRHPRTTYISTNGQVRGGVFDSLLERSLDVLNGKTADNGLLPFICRLDGEKEIHDKTMWGKANPSLTYFPTLQKQIDAEYADYAANPLASRSFASKRMNLAVTPDEGEIATWDEIKATNQPVPLDALAGMPCVAGIDYASTRDLISAGILYLSDGKYYWHTHTWVCRTSKDLPRIKVPLDSWADEGLLTFVDAAEIAPEIPVAWLFTEAARQNSKIIKIGIDRYRFTLLKNALLEHYFSPDKEVGNVFWVRPTNEMTTIPIISSGFANKSFCWGDNPLMRWAARNSKLVTSSKGNTTYDKIEPKSRKTDPFKAFVAAMVIADELNQFHGAQALKFEVFTY